jgi:diacylglycerol kinase (ATP)
MNNNMFNNTCKPTGIRRIYLATQNSSRAFAWLFKNESAFRQECFLLIVATPITFMLNINVIEQVLLISSILIVLLTEVINTAVEAVVDRIGLEMNPLSGLAKDLGSAAVALSLLMMVMIWFGIVFFN